MRLLAKRMAPLVRQKQSLGQLQVLLRLTFDAVAPARGVLVFEWPNAAHGHSIVSVLERWSGRCADGASRDGSMVLSCRSVENADDRTESTHLKVEFEVATLSESTDELLALAARVGLSDVLGGRGESAPKAKPAAEPAAKSVAEPVTKSVAKAIAPTPAPAAPSRPRVQPVEPKVSRPVVDPDEQAAIDNIAHNAVFDPSTHPPVSVNDEVTASSGVTFRLITKRLGGQRRRVWIRVAGGAQSVSRAG